MFNKRDQIPVVLLFSGLATLGSYGATTFVEVVFSTGTTDTLTSPNPNLVVQEEDAALLSYTMTTSDSSVINGTLSNVNASIFLLGLSAMDNDDNISGLSLPSSPSTGNPYYVTTITQTEWGSGAVAAEPDDIVLYDPATNTASIFWNGGAATGQSFEIDGLHVFADGTFLISTEGDETLFGIGVDGGDILHVDPDAGTASLFFKGEDVYRLTENTNGIYVDSQGVLYLSTENSATIGDLTFRDGDIVRWGGGENATVVFAESDHMGAGEEIDAIGHFVPEPSSSLLVCFAMILPVLKRRRAS